MVVSIPATYQWWMFVPKVTNFVFEQNQEVTLMVTVVKKHKDSIGQKFSEAVKSLGSRKYNVDYITEEECHD